MKGWTRVLTVLCCLACAPQEDAVDRVAAALGSGTAAHSRAARARAAAVLQDAGAHPLDGDPDLARRWRAPAVPAWRDRALGPGYRTLTLSAGGALRLDQTFLAGRRARVVAVGPVPPAFTLTISEPGMTMACPATRNGRACDWVPDHTARFGIDLANTGRTMQRLFLVVQ